MKTIKRPELKNLDDYKCSDYCDKSDWPCHCHRGRGKAYRSNASVNQAIKLNAINQIEEINDGVWLVCNKWYFHPSSRLGRPKGVRCEYQKFKNFTEFWKYINDKEKASEWNVKRKFHLKEEDKPIDRRKLLSDDDPMPIGKYRGREIKYVPDNYLMFLWKMFHFSQFKEKRGKAGYVAEYIERRIKNKQLSINPEI